MLPALPEESPDNNDSRSVSDNGNAYTFSTMSTPVAMSAAPSPPTSLSPQEMSFSPQEWADTGLVCAGPSGMPVCGSFFKFFEMVRRVRPELLNYWPSEGLRTGFFNILVATPSTYPRRKCYAVFQGSGRGPGIYDRWELVFEAVYNVAGSLYQKCDSVQEAACRMAQALSIEGLVSHLPFADERSGSMEAWWDCVGPGCSYPYLRVLPTLLPIKTTSTPVTLPDTPWEMLQEGAVVRVEMSIMDPDAQELAQRTPPSPDIAIKLPSRLSPQLPEGLLVSGVHRTATALPVLPEGPATHGFSPTPRQSRRHRSTLERECNQEPLPDRRGYFAVFRGAVPWLYYSL
ncbi:hypothetical protein C8Q78DRAFT_1081040 [Trametes maxima]|nr:hypothetical protein C8Q78DRAFT_1081040 [Trametes maxima]